MINKVKGTYDIYKNSKKNLYIKKIIKKLMDKYNYNYIQTPIIEKSELFHRGVGETTDIITKETYDFKDRGGRNISLRPEGTAGIVRSFIENKMYSESLPVKLWYYGSMFRYERPQSGRNREFTQFGIESFGVDNPMIDAEVISILVNFLKELKLKNIKVNINTLGDKEVRKNYREALLKYFKPYLNDLCDDCKERYHKNPLRLLDCKIDSKKDIFKNIPKISNYLNEESKNHFNTLKEYLDVMNIDYIVNDNLVRGLDYYTHTVFEVEADIDGFGSQNVLGAGGRYNNLVESLDGPKISGVGFAVGIERLMLALEHEKIDFNIDDSLDVYIFSLDKKYNSEVLSLANNLRLNNYKVDIDFNNKNIKNNFKKADKLKSKYIVILGEEEVKNKLLTVKDNITKEEYKVKTNEIINFLNKKKGEQNENK